MAKIERLAIDLELLLGKPATEGAGEFRSLWKKSVDPDEAEHSTAVSLKEGKLTVCVDNSVYLQNFLLKRNDILRRINGVSQEKKVNKISFKLGSAD